MPPVQQPQQNQNTSKSDSLQDSSNTIDISNEKPKSKKINKYAGIISFIASCVALCAMLIAFCFDMSSGYGGGEFYASIKIQDVIIFLIIFGAPLAITIIFWRKTRKENLDKKQKTFGNVGLILAGLTVLLFLTDEILLSILPSKPSKNDITYQDNTVLSLQTATSCNRYTKLYNDKYFVCKKDKRNETNMIISSDFDIYKFSNGQKVAQITDAIGYQASDEKLYFITDKDNQKTIHEINENNDTVKSTNISNYIKNGSSVYNDEDLIGYISEDNKIANIITKDGLKTITVPEGSEFTGYNFTRSDQSVENGGYLIYSQSESQNGIISMDSGEIKIPASENQYFDGILTYKSGRVALMNHDLTILTDYLYSARLARKDSKVHFQHESSGNDILGWSPSEQIFLIFDVAALRTISGTMTEKGAIDVFDKTGNKLVSLDSMGHKSTLELTMITDLVGTKDDVNMALYNSQKATFIMSDGKIIERNLSEFKGDDIYITILDDIAHIIAHKNNDESLNYYKNIYTWESAPNPQNNNSGNNNTCSIVNPDNETDLEFSINLNDDSDQGSTVTVKRFGKEIGKISNCKGEIETIGQDRFLLYNNIYDKRGLPPNNNSDIWYVEAKEK